MTVYLSLSFSLALVSRACKIICTKSTYRKPSVENVIAHQYITVGQYKKAGYVTRKKTVTNILFPKCQILDSTNAVNMVAWKNVNFIFHQAKLLYVFATVMSHCILTIFAEVQIVSILPSVAVCIAVFTQVANRNMII